MVLSALLIPLIREDTGVLLVAVGAWLLVRERQRWPLALAFIAWGGGWVMACTNLLMPMFSDDNAKRFMVENFGQYLSEDTAAGSSSLGTLQQVPKPAHPAASTIGGPPRPNPALPARARVALSVYSFNQP